METKTTTDRNRKVAYAGNKMFNTESKVDRWLLDFKRKLYTGIHLLPPI